MYMRTWQFLVSLPSPHTLLVCSGLCPPRCDGLQRDSFKSHLALAIDHLPPREKLVLALYYDEELNLKEIGEVIGVSESRVSQIHSQAAAEITQLCYRQLPR